MLDWDFTYIEGTRKSYRPRQLCNSVMPNTREHWSQKKFPVSVGKIILYLGYCALVIWIMVEALMK